MKAILLMGFGAVLLLAIEKLAPPAIYALAFCGVALAGIVGLATWKMSEPLERCFKCEGIFQKSEMHWTLATQLRAPRAFCGRCATELKLQ